MKIISKILDYYYSKKFTESLEEIIRAERNIDFNAKCNHGCIDIFLKPKKHKEYTFICSFKQKDALECLVADKKKFLKFINESIDELSKKEGWL